MGGRLENVILITGPRLVLVAQALGDRVCTTKISLRNKRLPAVRIPVWKIFEIWEERGWGCPSEFKTAEPPHPLDLFYVTCE
jgi:hypothetical protein